ncbi:MAG: hypothetical protein ABSC13_03665 [Dehalococcoidia bacterium]|jgi:hypothetical protein
MDEWEGLGATDTEQQETVFSPLAAECPRMALPQMYLRRLQRLLEVRKSYGGQLNFEGTRLIDKAIYATYCDCLAVDSLDAAQEVLRRATVTAPE